MKLDLIPLYRKHEHKMSQRPIRPKTLKCFEEGIEEKLHDFGFGNNFLNMTPKSIGNKRENR